MTRAPLGQIVFDLGPFGAGKCLAEQFNAGGAMATAAGIANEAKISHVGLMKKAGHASAPPC